MSSVYSQRKLKRLHEEVDKNSINEEADIGDDGAIEQSFKHSRRHERNDDEDEYDLETLAKRRVNAQQPVQSNSESTLNNAESKSSNLSAIITVNDASAPIPFGKL